MSRLGFIGIRRLATDDRAAPVLAALDEALRESDTITVQAEVIEDDRPTLRSMPAASVLAECRPLDEVILECLMSAP